MHRFKSALFLGIGLLLLTATLYSYLDTLAFLDQAKRAPGQVVALNAGGSHPQISFTDEQGRQHSYPQGGLIFGYEAGEAVQVLYLAEKPAPSARLEAFAALWAEPLLCGLLGLAFTLLVLCQRSR